MKTKIAMKITGIIAGATLMAGATFSAALATTFTNGDFEGGVYSDNFGGATNTNTKVPIGWTPNLGFDEIPAYNGVEEFFGVGGSYALKFGNYSYQDASTLSQTFTDVSGQNYTVDFYAYSGIAGNEGNPVFLSVNVGVHGITQGNGASTTYQLYTFSFTGNGTDTLVISGYNNPSYWYLDNFTVEATATPLPAALPLFAGGLGVIGLLARRRKRKAAALAA
jgi:hypothetical protein